MLHTPDRHHAGARCRGFARQVALLAATLAWISGGAMATDVPPARVDINRADASALAAQLPGVGPVKAQAIIDYRERHGRYSAVEDLLDVKGIGPVTLEKLRPLVEIAGIDAALGSDVGQAGGQWLPLGGAGPPATNDRAMRAVGPPAHEGAGYFSIDSTGPVGPREAGDPTEQATVRAVREIVRRVLEEGTGRDAP